MKQYRKFKGAKVVARPKGVTLAALGEYSPRVSYICYDEILTNKNSSDGSAAVISVGSRVCLQVSLVRVHKCLDCSCIGHSDINDEDG